MATVCYWPSLKDCCPLVGPLCSVVSFAFFLGTLHSISFPRGCHILAPNLIRACFINCRASFLTCNGEEEHVQQKAPGLEWGG